MPEPSNPIWAIWHVGTGETLRDAEWVMAWPTLCGLISHCADLMPVLMRDEIGIFAQARFCHKLACPECIAIYLKEKTDAEHNG